MNVALFFTYDVSLKDWKELGLLDRELELYNTITKETDIQYTFVTYGEDNEKSLLSGNKNIKILPIGNLINYKNKVLKYILSFLLPFKLKKKLKHIDILKTNQLMGSWIPIILKYITKKPLIVRTGYDPLDFAIKENKSKFKVTLYYLLALFSIKCSDMYFVSSRRDIENIDNRFKFLSRKNIYHRPNWVKIADSNKKIGERKKEYLLSVGRLETQKNYINLLSNIANSSLKVDIIGSGSLENEIKNFAKMNNVNVKFTGNIKHSQLMNLYEDYMFYVMFSKYEGHPKTLIEAMSKGCIPIVLKNENNIEIIEHNQNGILLNSEDDSIEKWVIHFKNNEKEMKRLSFNAMEFAKEKYSLNKSVMTEINDYKILNNQNR